MAFDCRSVDAPRAAAVDIRAGSSSRLRGWPSDARGAIGRAPSITPGQQGRRGVATCAGSRFSRACLDRSTASPRSIRHSAMSGKDFASHSRSVVGVELARPISRWRSRKSTLKASHNRPPEQVPVSESCAADIRQRVAALDHAADLTAYDRAGELGEAFPVGCCLYGEGADPAGRPDDEHPVPGAPRARRRGSGRGRPWSPRAGVRPLLERQGVRREREAPHRRDSELGERRVILTEHLVADLPPGVT